jgi:hypothetical protein
MLVDKYTDIDHDLFNTAVLDETVYLIDNRRVFSYIWPFTGAGIEHLIKKIDLIHDGRAAYLAL